MYAYMMVHPGKKLNFMGNELGHLREWDESREQDWDIRTYPIHDAFYKYMCELNHLYLEHPALFTWDYRREGFQWLDCNQEEQRIYVILRQCENEKIAAILHFSDLVRENYELKLEGVEAVEPLLYSDWQRFGGNTAEEETLFRFEGKKLICHLKPFSALILRLS